MRFSYFISKCSFIVLATILLSCNGKSKNIGLTLAPFPKTINVAQYLTKSMDADDFNDPVFQAYDSLLVVLDRGHVDGFIRIYNNQNLNLIASYGIVGRGPNEYITPSILHVDSYNKDIWFMDFTKQTFYCIPLSKVLESNSSIAPSVSFPIPMGLMPIFNYAILENDNILVSTTKDSAMLTELNRDGEIVKSYGLGIDERENFPHQALFNYFYYKNIAFNRNTGTVVGTFHYLEKVFKLNTTTEESIEYYGSNYSHVKPNIINHNIANNQHSYSLQISQTENYVFASYIGGDYIQQSSSISINYPQEIHVFDWDANPIARLIFPEPIIYFDINKCGEIFVYANCVDNQYQIYELNLMELN